MFDEDDEKRFPRITLGQFLLGLVRQTVLVVDSLSNWLLMELLAQVSLQKPKAEGHEQPRPTVSGKPSD